MSGFQREISGTFGMQSATTNLNAMVVSSRVDMNLKKHGDRV